MSLEFILSNSEVSKYWGQQERVSGMSVEERALRLEEVSGAYRKLRDFLSSLGFTRETGLGEHYDYYQNEDVGLYRSVDFEITNPRMVRKDVLERVAEFLNGLPQEYCALISNDFEDSLEIFLIAVTKTAVYGRFETMEMARAFGFNPTEGEIGPIG